LNVELPIIGEYAKKDPLVFAPDDTLNLYLSENKNGEKGLLGTPGLDGGSGIKFNNSGGVRQMYVSRLSANMHTVVGSVIYQIDSALNKIFGTNLDTNAGYVGIDDDRTQMLFVDGNAGYLYDKSTNIYTKITDPQFPVLPIDVAAFGDRFYVIENDSNKIAFSDIKNGNSWNTLDEFKITSYPDNAVGLEVLHGHLFVFGRRCTETWVLQGGEFPIALDESLVMEYGCIAAGTIAKEAGIMGWVGYDKQGITSVVVSSGGHPTRISTPEIERILQSYSIVDDARAFMYLEKGNLFYQLNFTAENQSWLYCFTTKSWSRLAYKDSDRHRAQCYAFFKGKKFVGDYENSIIYEFKSNYYSDDGIAIKRKRTTSVLYPNKGKPFCCQYLRFIVEQGVGAESYPNDDPKIMLRISRDSGATFDNQIRKVIGKLGQTRIETEFYRLGYFRYGSIVIDVEFYNMTDFSLLKCYSEITV
jgi:hypothetical protein